MDIDKLVSNNKGTYPALNKTVPLRAGTKLHLPPPIDPNAPPLPDWHLPCLNLLKKVPPPSRREPCTRSTRLRGDLSGGFLCAYPLSRYSMFQVQESRFAGPFLDPVQWEELELWDYPWIVTRPMDLSTVHNKLINRWVTNP